MAGSINLANVALGFDASKIVKGVEISGGELRKLNTMFQGSISSTDRYNAAMEILDKSRKSGALTADRLVQVEASLAAKYGMETDAMKAAAVASANLEQQKKREIATKQQAADRQQQIAANEQRFGDLLAKSQGAMLAKEKQIDSQLALGASLRNQVATAQETLTSKTRQYDQYLKEGIIDLGTYNRLLKQLKDNQNGVGGVGKDKDKNQGIGGDIKSTLAQYAGMAAAFAGVKKSLSLAATAESNKISLEVLTGSATKAKFLFDGFRELDQSSPLSRSDFSRAAQTLIGYGFAAESTLPTLKQLSEVSIGNADRFQSLSLAFGQVQAQGRLMGQEVLQMVNAGFNPLQEISRTTGRSMVDLKAAMADGAISATMVGDAFNSATSKGGRFFEMNERLKNSAAGQYAKMQADVELVATEIGTNLLPAAKALMDLLKSGSDGKGGTGILGNLAGAFATGAEGIMAFGEDMTNRNLNAGNSKGRALLERVQMEQMKTKLEKEYLHVNTKEENERIQKTLADRAAKERKELEEIAKKDTDKLAATKAYDKQVEALQKQLDLKQKGAQAAKEEAALRKGLSKDQISELGRLTGLVEAAKKLAAAKKKQAASDKAAKTKDTAKKKRLMESAMSKARSRVKANRGKIAKSPNGMELGSAEAAKFFADQFNEQVAKQYSKSAESEKELLKESKKQLVALQKQNAIDEKILEELKNNGFKRIR